MISCSNCDTNLIVLQAKEAQHTCTQALNQANTSSLPEKLSTVKTVTEKLALTHLLLHLLASSLPNSLCFACPHTNLIYQAKRLTTIH